MAKLKYQARKGTRIKDRFTSICISFDCPHYSNLWYFDELDKWMDPDKYNQPHNGYGSHKHIWRTGPRTVRAFRRWLRRQRSYLPAGVQFVLESRYIGHNVTGST